MKASKIPPLEDLQEGVHLFHLGPSNCSRRVRIALEEKSVEWTSHIVDLAKNEHAEAAYLALNPNGVIPTLVHNGKVFVESNDIIQYIDKTFPGPQLLPDDADDLEYCILAMRETGGIQHHIKAITYQWRLRPFVSYDKNQITAFDNIHPNKQLVEFIKDYSDDSGSWEGRVEAAEKKIHNLLIGLERRLTGRDYLSGKQFGLADISWFAHIIHLQDANYDIKVYSNVLAWVDRLKSRKSYQLAVENWLSIPSSF